MKIVKKKDIGWLPASGLLRGAAGQGGFSFCYIPDPPRGLRSGAAGFIVNNEDGNAIHEPFLINPVFIGKPFSRDTIPSLAPVSPQSGDGTQAR